MPSLRLLPWLLVLSGTAAAPLVAQAPPTAAYTIPEPDRTRFFPVRDGLLGSAGPTGLPTAQGIDWGRFMGGAAYAMRFAPTGGPDCTPDAEDPRIEFWTLTADSSSRLAINAEAQLGALFVAGTVRHYVQAGDFCTSKSMTESGTGRPGYLYLPFAPMGWSLRNFSAAGLTLVREDDRISSAAVAGSDPMAARVPGRLTSSGLDLKLVGYASPDLLGVSQALSDGPGGSAAADALRRYASDGPVADALRKMPGVTPGERGEGYFELTLGDRPASEIGGQNTAFAYVHVRIVHDGRELSPSRAYAAAVAAIRATGEVIYDPATPNDRRRP